MKKTYAFVMVIALLVMNIASVAHADCAEGFVCNDVHLAESADQHDHQHDDSQQANCDCCTTCSGHHHHSHMAHLDSKAEPIVAFGQTAHSIDMAAYASQLLYPPSKPPKA